MHVEDSQLKAFLLDAGLVTKDALAQAEKTAHESGAPLRDVLLQKELVAADDLKRLEAYILGIPFVDLTHDTIDQEVLRIIPEPIARKHNIVAFKKRGDAIEVAMLDPDDIQTIEFIKKKEKQRIIPRLTNPESIQHALKKYQKTLEAEFSAIIKKEADAFTAVPDKEGSKGENEAEELKKLSEDLPVVRIVDTLIRHAVLQSASDIHIEPLEKEVVTRYRIDGILHDAMTLPKHIAPGLVARIKVMANLKLDEHRLPQDGRFKIASDQSRLSVRVSVLPVFDGEKIVMRLLSESGKGYTLEELGFREETLERVQRAIKKPTGIILVTGPTGCGKTTTLYTILEILNTPAVNISTIEDPIEYRMPRVNQTQVRPDIGFTFATGLRTLLRQDPDIIMVGEIRDNETAGLAINAALTGHLVLSTLHTNSASGALPRLLDMKVEPFLIASTVHLIVSQRLVRRLCEEWEKYRLSGEETESLKKELDIERLAELLKKEKAIDAKTPWERIEWGRAKKADECPDGYRGRIGIHEALAMSDTIKELVLKNASADEIQAQARKEGMTTMLEEGFIRAAEHVTSIEEVLRVTSE